MKAALHLLGLLLLFALFLALYFGGGILILFHLDPFGSPHWFVSHPTATTVRYFVPTGLLLMTLVWLILSAVQAATRRLRRAALWTTGAFLLALIVGLAGQFGWVSTT